MEAEAVFFFVPVVAGDVFEWLVLYEDFEVAAAAAAVGGFFFVVGFGFVGGEADVEGECVSEGAEADVHVSSVLVGCAFVVD